MKCHSRCRKCRSRRALARHPDAYQIQPRCRNCGSRDHVADKWMNERNTKAMTCRCDGHGSGLPFPHRRGSLWCYYLASGEWKSTDRFAAELASIEQSSVDN